MKRSALLALFCLFLSCYPETEVSNNKEVVVEKSFRDDNTFVIVCNGWPKDTLTGLARAQSAREAALINAQFSSKDLFDESIDTVKNGTVEKYEVLDDYARVYYVITKTDLKKHYKE